MLVSNLLTALGVARLRVARGVFTRQDGLAGFSRMLPPRWLQKVPAPSRIREACSVKFPTDGCGATIVYLLTGHSGVYVGKARLERKKMCGMGPRALEHLRALLYTNVRDGTKPRYRILRRSLGSVFMLPAFWFDSEERALAIETVLIKLESPECNVVDRTGLMNVERCKVKGKRKRPSSWPRRPKLSLASIWSHLSVQMFLHTCFLSFMGIEIPGCSWPRAALQHAADREMFARDGMLGPINL